MTSSSKETTVKGLTNSSKETTVKGLVRGSRSHHTKEKVAKVKVGVGDKTLCQVPLAPVATRVQIAHVICSGSLVITHNVTRRINSTLGDLKTALAVTLALGPRQSTLPTPVVAVVADETERGRPHRKAPQSAFGIIIGIQSGQLSLLLLT